MSSLPHDLRTLGLVPEDDLTSCLNLDSGVIPTGGFCDVRRADFKNASNIRFAVKVVRKGSDIAQQRSRQHLLQDMKALKHASHPNVQPFAGICFIDEHGLRQNTRLLEHVCLVTPWANGANLRKFLQTNENANRRNILRQIAQGLQYLHSQTVEKSYIVHGDLHITNILMHDGVPLISDFGLSEIGSHAAAAAANNTDDSEMGLVGSSSADLDMPPGHYTSLAPEIALEKNARRTTKSDVYSFGLLLFEVYAGHGPYPASPRNGFSALVRLCSTHRPPRSDIQRPDFTDDLWRVTEACWAQDAAARPEMPEVCRRLA